MTMATMNCPHCGAANAAGAAFCEACGKALPNPSMGPRIVSGDALPQSVAGQKLMSDQLKKETNRAAYTLLAVGILQMTCGAFVVAMLARQQGPQVLPFLIAIQFVVAAGFIGLYFWARVAPLPASIVGLVIYATLIVLNVVSAVSDMNSGGPRRGLGGLGVGWLDIVIIAFLAQGISAGLKHKRLMESAPTIG